MNKKVWKIITLCMIVAVLAFTPALVCEKADKEDEALKFDSSKGETLNVTVDTTPLVVIKYTVIYAAYPIKMKGQTTDLYPYQTMNIYVPATAANNQKTAIILAVNNGGWMPSAVKTSIVNGGKYVSTNDNDKIGKALAAGYIFVDVGTRSRGLVAADDTYAGHAPAVAVDAKAAIRYLRLNDELIPGSSERLVITGTSGGGGLSTIIAASGNSPDYYSYLEAIGSAGIDDNEDSTLNDDVFATIAYCPITDLNHADIAYEWQYSATRLLDAAYTDGPYDKVVSAALAAQYPAYLKSLRLRLEDGKKLTAETMPDAIKALVKTGVEKAMANGVTVPDLGETWSFTQRDGSVLVVTNDWLDVDNATKKVLSIDYDKYLAFVCKTAKLKRAPSFDNFGTPLFYFMNESNLAGDVTQEYSHWLDWSWENDNVSTNGVGYDDTGFSFDEFMETEAGMAVVKQMRMINPIPYLISNKGDSAPNWYVRHGIRDRDTSFAVELSLFYAIQNDKTVENANFALAYMQPHGGDYDVQEAYAWLAEVLKHPGKH